VAALIVLRIVHIAGGVFWAGGALFMNFVVGPALGAAGPEGSKVMMTLHKRRYFDVLVVTALLTILSGLDLLRRDSSGFSAAWFRTPFGTGLSTGMLAAIIAFLVGAFLMRPALSRLAALAGQAAGAPPAAGDALMVQVTAARDRLIAFGKVGSLFLIIAVLAMASARYW